MSEVTSTTNIFFFLTSFNVDVVFIEDKKISVSVGVIYWPAQSIIFWQEYLSLLFKLALQLEQAVQPFVNILVDPPPDKQRKIIPAGALR